MQLTSIFFFLAVAVARSSGARVVHSEYNTDCSKMDFRKIPTDCCMTPFGNVFPPEKMAPAFKKCKGNAKMLEWVNTYKINTIQSLRVNNFVDLNDKTVERNLCKSGAFAECVFKESGFLDASGLNITAIYESVLEAATNPAWKQIVYKTFYSMQPSRNTAYNFTDMVEDEFEQIKCSTGQVNLLPLMMAQMLQSEFTWMCPQQAWYSSSNKCEERMWAFKYCDGAIYSMQRRGVFYFLSG